MTKLEITKQLTFKLGSVISTLTRLTEEFHQLLELVSLLLVKELEGSNNE